VQVVPGVSSLMACADVAGAPLAARNDVLTVLPAPLPEDELMRRLAACDAAALIKVGRHLGKLRRVLGTLGLLDQARYVERATLGAQRVLPLEAAGETAPYFSMVLVHRRGEAWQ
jgi:precorrin-2/cobalt-factor-2 C20-methyltransferase